MTMEGPPVPQCELPEDYGARYRIRDAAMAKHLTQAEQEVEVESLASQLLNKMRGLFNIFHRSAPGER